MITGMVHVQVFEKMDLIARLIPLHRIVHPVLLKLM